MDKIIYANQYDYLSSLRREPHQLIKEMEDFAEANKIPILDWNAAELLEHIVITHKPKRVLEIGTAIAYSSIRIARTLKKKASIDTIEKSLDNIAPPPAPWRRADPTPRACGSRKVPAC